MSDLERLAKIIPDIEAAEDHDVLLHRLLTHLEPAGFSHGTIVQHRHRATGQNEPELVSNYPDDWLALTQEVNAAFPDLVLPALQKFGHALRWSDTSSRMPLDRKQAAVLKRVQQKGLGSGCTISCHEPLQPTISVSLVMADGQPMPDPSFLQAQLLGLAAGARARALWQKKRERPSADNENPLSPRQIECIKIVAAGKTSWEIATLLGISEQTVTEYLNDARRRLDVSTRAQLVLKALQQGYFSLDEVIE